MTIICYRDGVMAADSAAGQYSIRLAASVQKILKTPGGELVASCGPSTDGQAFRRWVLAGRDEMKKPDLSSNFCGLLVEADGVVKEYDGRMDWAEMTAPFFVLGSGAETAFGAMAFGASAIEAVEIAIKYCEGCGGPIQIERLAPR